MTTFDAILWALAAVLFAVAVWLSLPRPPPFEVPRMFGLIVATMLRGEVERANGKLPDWEAAIARYVPRAVQPPPGGWTIDPDDLGEDYAIDGGWEAIAEGRLDAIERRLQDVVFVEAGDDLEAACDTPATRLVITVRGDADPLLAALKAAPGLRDRVRALVFVGATVNEPLAHVDFDTEIARTTPWLVLRVAGSPKIEEPPVPPTDRRAIGVVDLGEVGEFGDALGRALRVVVAVL